MTDINKLITDNIDVWSSAVESKATTGRGARKKIELTGVSKLKELILELAIQGKLLPQDFEEETNSLLEDIKNQSSQLLKDKVIKRPKKFPEISKDEIPFSIPSNWKWVRIADIGHDWGQKKPEGEFSYVDVGSINKEYGFIQSPLVLPESDAPSRARKIVKKGTVIYSTVRPYLLNIAVVDIDFEPEPIASTAFAIIHPFEGINASFIYRYLRSPSFIKYVESCQTGVAYPAVNDKQFFSGLIPIPPVEEQNRIVNKVDELFALGDQLEQQTEASIDAHQLLVKELLSTLTNSNNAKEFEQNWARIAEHFDLLFTTEHSIEQLKQTILQLAVMGKLVQQDSTDEPASKLLERIAQEKEQLINDKEIKKPKKLPTIKSEDVPFNLPKGWEWSRLESLCELITKGSSPKWQGVAYTDNPNDILFVTSENVGLGKMLLDKRKYVEKHFNEVEPRSILRRNDFLMNIVGASIGRTAIYNQDILANINQAVCLIRLVGEHFNKAYLLRFFNSAVCTSYMYDKQVDNARANLSMGNISKFVIPVPPLAEQKRIASKVEELLRICNQITTNIVDAKTIQVHLAESIVEQALN